MVKNNIIDNIPLDGGVLCLDFVNTVPNWLAETKEDYFSGYEDLLYWAKRLELVNAKAYKDLSKYAATHPAKTVVFFTQAQQLRQLLYNMFLAISKGEIIAPEDLQAFNAFLSQHCSSLQIKHDGESYSENWECEDDLRYLTSPVIQSAYKLLLSDKLNRIKACPNCGWLFLDTTKNGKRRWCSMQSCGSNAKATEYYYRKKNAENT